MRILAAALALAALALPARGEAASLRCGNNLASDGNSPSEVRFKCGEPMSTAHREETTSTRTKARQGDGENSTSQSTTTSVTIHIEEWTYNFGPNRLMQVVTFKDGKLTDVHSTSYGK
ncbi:DUF2845 domain-containing protein [Myxococcus sp. K15C18031901]|uniref:DUF2845 domain-containing protein n=1 Tax=Myxococcus dinghuensis TaxID=2906761 RepID=UPI0020A6DF44|nr:DUF2845 domain-containing protein [Myxococcus dinghuensis]MCP3102645.1 DUF2845 domain-containing protein [Myxococcus dinghuensis]